MWRDGEERGEERKVENGKISDQEDGRHVGECVERVKHAIVRLLLLLSTFFVPILGCEPLEEEKSAETSREKMKESSDFDRVKARNYLTGK